MSLALTSDRYLRDKRKVLYHQHNLLCELFRQQEKGRTCER